VRCEERKSGAGNCPGFLIFLKNGSAAASAVGPRSCCTERFIVFASITTGEHQFTAETADRPGDPHADVRAELSLDIGGDAVVHLWSNALVFVFGQAKLHVYGNAMVYAFGEAEVFFHGDGRLDIGGRAVAHVSSRVFSVATEHAQLFAPSGGRVLAYGDARIDAGPLTEVSRNGRATVIRDGIVEGPPSQYRGGYIVSHH